MTSELEANIVAVERTKEYSELANEVCGLDYRCQAIVSFCLRHQQSVMITAHLIIGLTQVGSSLNATPLGIERDLIWYSKRLPVILMVEKR